MISIRRLAFCNLLFAFTLVAFGFCQQFDAKLFQELHWRLIGPFRGGRGVAISGVPGQPNVFYMAPNNGGVWKTTDYGRTWNPIFDDQPTGSVGALAIAPSNPEIIYVGSGEGLRPPRSLHRRRYLQVHRWWAHLATPWSAGWTANRRHPCRSA